MLLYVRCSSDIVFSYCLVRGRCGEEYISQFTNKWFSARCLIICMELAYYVFMGCEIYPSIITERDFVFADVTCLGSAMADTLCSSEIPSFCCILMRWISHGISAFRIFVLVLAFPVFLGVAAVLYSFVTPSAKMMYSREFIGIP